MSTLSETVIELESRIVNINCKTNGKSVKTKKKKCALKSKENIFKPQCRRELKKKLKKYKLRRDGQEDQEVLDVSQILVSALKIKSPTNNVLNDIQEERRPKNYLFKMGRGKQIIKKRHLDKCHNDTVRNIKESKCVESNVEVCTNIENNKEYQLTENDNSKAANDETNKYKDKKPTNAFQLMMDSRNKSIGSNSPGKDKVIDETEMQDFVEKKSIKAKRNLLLQKMAEAKGSLKKKANEEYHEMCIKKKIEERAERLKKMVSNIKTKPEQDDSDVEIVSTKKETPNNDVHLLSSEKTLKLINIFHEPSQNVNDSNTKQVQKIKEDDEFLKKLSPSLKKKENMLCYFKKVEKDQESDDILNSQSGEDETVIIKVKMPPKSKKTSKKKKLSLNKDVLNDDSHMGNKKNGNKPFKKNNNKEKNTQSYLKSYKNEDTEIVGSLKNTEICNELLRPRRNVKRPAKYIDDVQPSSSDEELHIFTPKKKKQIIIKNCVTETKIEIQPETSKISSNETNKSSRSKKNIKMTNDDSQQTKTTKLAPIFAAKPQLDAAAIEAKQKFLSSGVPEKLKKTMEKQSHKHLGSSSYYTVVHVQQKELPILDKLSEYNFSLSDINEDPALDIIYGNGFFKKIMSSTQLSMINSNLVFVRSKTHDMLQKIKQLYPKFPVYRTYRMLRDKNRGEFKDCSYLDLDNSIEVINGLIDINNESPDKLNWTDKYKAMSSKQIIGNFETIKELKKWLISWTENDVKLKKDNGAESDSSDFYQSDTDSKDSIKSTNNLLVLTGPAGSGKTSIIYAVAAELAIKVLEVNASSKRTGKIMLQDLQEATQSHKVNRGKSSQESSQRSQDITTTNENQNKVKKRGRPKKSPIIKTTLKKTESVANNEVLSQNCSQDSTRTCMSLILIDDADIVFEQDDGFCSAIVQLVQCSKRPVILITSSITCPHLQRFVQIAKVIHTRPFFPRMLGTWLDILCLADNGTCWPGLGAKILDYFNGDIRKCMNFLQFYTVRDLTNDSEIASQNCDHYKIDLEDENSSMSWTDRIESNENIEKGHATNSLDVNIWEFFLKEQTDLCHFKHSLKLFIIWWNVPKLVSVPLYCNIKGESEAEESRKEKNKHRSGMDILSNIADMISIADCFGHNNMQFALTSVPWANFESHSVSEQESLDKYDRNHEIMDEISHSLITGSILTAQRALELEHKTQLDFPGMAMKREWDKVATRHNSVTSYLNPSAALDRRALALDYWSSCRSICRIEKSRTDSNSKRNNRFYHYLKSVNILSKIDNLGDSLCSKESM